MHLFRFPHRIYFSFLQRHRTRDPHSKNALADKFFFSLPHPSHTNELIYSFGLCFFSSPLNVAQETIISAFKSKRKKSEISFITQFYSVLTHNNIQLSQNNNFSQYNYGERNFHYYIFTVYSLTSLQQFFKDAFDTIFHF